MRRTIGILTLAAMVLAGAAAAEERDIVPTAKCTPWSKWVIMGLCSAEQKAEAKKMQDEERQKGVDAQKQLEATKKELEETRKQVVAQSEPAPTRPARRGEVSVQLPAEDMTAVDAWAAQQPDKPSRAEAIRRLVQKGLGS